MGALSAGKTLLPYKIIGEENSKNTRVTGIVTDNSYKEYIYDYTDGIKYYGGKVGNIEQLKDFNDNDLLAMSNMKDINDCIENGEAR